MAQRGRFQPPLFGQLYGAGSSLHAALERPTGGFDISFKCGKVWWFLDVHGVGHALLTRYAADCGKPLIKDCIILLAIRVFIPGTMFECQNQRQ